MNPASFPAGRKSPVVIIRTMEYCTRKDITIKVGYSVLSYSLDIIDYKSIYNDIKYEIRSV